MDKIYKILVDLGMPIHLLGFEFAHSTIQHIITNCKVDKTPITELYHIIGKIHNANNVQVERNIRHSIEYAIKRGLSDTWIELFGNKQHVTNSEFLYTVALYCKNSVDEQNSNNNKSGMIVAGRYKAFFGIMEINFGGNLYGEVKDNWIFDPNKNYWYNSTSVYDANKCKIIKII